MPFIGQSPLTGAYHVLDAITASATATYNLQLNSGAFSPATANQLIVSLNGVIQKPGSSFTVSGSTFTFSSALTSSDNIDFIMALGDVLNVGTPTDGTVSTAKIQNDAITTAKIVNDAVTSAKIPSNAITNAQLAGGITSAKFASNAIGTQTAGENIVTQKFYYTNVSPNQQPINTSFTLSATEAPLGSWVILRNEVLSGSASGDQYCYIYQQGGTGFNSHCYVEGWYYYSTQTTLFPIRDAADRTFNISHGTIAHSTSGDYRKVFYMGYWKVTE